MTRKDYTAFANEIASLRKDLGEDSSDDVYVVELVARRMCKVFAADNANFDKQKFLSACGI